MKYPYRDISFVPCLMGNFPVPLGLQIATTIQQQREGHQFPLTIANDAPRHKRYPNTITTTTTTTLRSYGLHMSTKQDGCTCQRWEGVGQGSLLSQGSLSPLAPINRGAPPTHSMDRTIGTLSLSS
jgi:hypothetical protein